MSLMRAIFFLIFLLGSLFPWAGPLRAQDATLQNIIVTNTRDDLLVFLRVEGAFTEEMVSVIQSGVPTSFSVFVELYRVRTYWPDEKVSEIKVTHTIKYDNLKNKYFVSRSTDTGKPLVTESIQEAGRWMSEVDSLRVAPLRILKKGVRYQIRAKAELSRLTLPLNLHNLLFFVSIWDFETDWYTVDFIF